MPIRTQIYLIAGALVMSRIALAGEPLLLTVEHRDASNVLFRVKNTSTNSLRLPSAGYALSGHFFPANTNPAYSIIERPIISCGLWLTADWRHVGTNWFWASREDWRRHLQIRTLKSGETLEVARHWNWEQSFLRTNSNAIVRFCFQIPKDWADDYGLFHCSLCVTGFTERVTK